ADGKEQKRGSIPRHYRYSRLCRHDPAARPGPRNISGVHDLDPRIVGNALDRKHDRRGADDFVLRVAVRLPAQPAVPALAALRLTGVSKPCRTFSQTSGWASTSRPTRTTSCSVCSVPSSEP